MEKVNGVIYFRNASIRFKKYQIIGNFVKIKDESNNITIYPSHEVIRIVINKSNNGFGFNNKPNDGLDDGLNGGFSFRFNQPF